MVDISYSLFVIGDILEVDNANEDHPSLLELIDVVNLFVVVVVVIHVVYD